MSSLIEPLHFSESRTAPVVDEVRWQAWLEAGYAQEQRGDARRIAVLEYLAIAVLIAASQAVKGHNYGFGVVFGALAVLYNPLAPVIGFSGDWQRAASALPFVASLAWGKRTI